MKLKSYFSGTVEAAMELARKELGDDALLVNARPATPETRYLGAYEVVFGTTAEGEQAKAGSEPARPERPASSQQTHARQTPNAPTAVAPSATVRAEASLEARLRTQEVDGDFARALQQGQPFEGLFEVDAQLGCPGDGRNLVALVGPPGAGKTTTLAKLVSHYGRASRKAVRIVSVDLWQRAGDAPLRALACELGFGFSVAESAADLLGVLEEHRSHGPLFIDTPGISRAEVDDSAELAHLIATYPGLDTHLVLPAFMRAPDLNRMLHRYSTFQPRKLLFTRIDETGQFGPLVTLSANWSMPISFLGTGQHIPDDLEPATYPRLAELVLGSAFAPARTPSGKTVPRPPLDARGPWELSKGAQA